MYTRRITTCSVGLAWLALATPSVNAATYALSDTAQNGAAATMQAQNTAAAPTAAQAARPLPEIIPNDNRRPAGQLRDGVLTLVLEARIGLWYPEENDGPGIEMQAFGEPGGPLLIPGPVVRVPEGTEIRVTVRNLLAVPLNLHGLYTRPDQYSDVIEVPPGGEREARFLAGAPGTYFYWGNTTGATSGAPLLGRLRADSQLTGAFIVDPPGASAADADRIFVIGLWSEILDATAKPPTFRSAFAINGRSWPHTERLSYRAGETVRWRWINGSIAFHPMHLHGHYFRVESMGDLQRDTHYNEALRRLVVTQLMPPGGTMALTWLPARPGNWLFHCHVIPHISPELRLGRGGVHGASAHGEAQHALESMAGLVLGLRVLPLPHAARVARARPRELRLNVELLSGRFGKDPGYGVSLEEGRGGGAPAAAPQLPGPPLVLTRGQPARITVVNRLPETTAIHWHGVELPSYFDGVPGLSGDPGHIAPPISPGGTFVAEFTPPRAGTFIYHSHMDDQRQLSSGLYGALIVLEPGERFDAETDRVLLFGQGGPSELNAPLLLNGSVPGAPMELRAGVKYRFRLINITPHDPRLSVSLVADAPPLAPAGPWLGPAPASSASTCATPPATARPVAWRALGKDGASLPPALATVGPATLTLSVGETYEFEFRPEAPGELRLEIFRPRVLFRPAARYTVPIHVR